MWSQYTCIFMTSMLIINYVVVQSLSRVRLFVTCSTLGSPVFHCLPEFAQIHVHFPTPVLLPGKSQGRRNLVGCGLCGCQESDTTERLHFHFSLSCIGEGNGNPLQCSCLENPRDGGAWWAAIYGVAQSWTRLKRLSSSSMSIELVMLSNHLTFCSPLLLLP